MYAIRSYYEERTVFEIMESKKIKELSYYLVNRKYTGELGLEIDVEEDSCNSNTML